MHLTPLNLEICVTMNINHSSSFLRSGLFFSFYIKMRDLLNPRVEVRTKIGRFFTTAFGGK